MKNTYIICSVHKQTTFTKYPEKHTNKEIALRRVKQLEKQMGEFYFYCVIQFQGDKLVRTIYTSK